MMGPHKLIGLVAQVGLVGAIETLERSFASDEASGNDMRELATLEDRSDIVIDICAGSGYFKRFNLKRLP